MALTVRQKEITEAALKLIAELGIQHLTIRNLSKSVGVTEAAIYRHFQSKNEIVRALIDSFEDAVRWRDDLRGWKSIRQFAMDRIDLILQNPFLAHVYFSEEIFQDDAESRNMLQEILNHHKENLKKRFLEAKEDGGLRDDVSIDLLPCIVYGPVRLLIKHWGLSGHAFDLTRRCRQLLDTLESLLQSPQ